MAKQKKKEEPWWSKGLDAVDEVLSAPQRAATWAVTGALTGKPKYEDPSEALGIDAKKHPYLKVLTDVVLDPTNLLGVGLVSKAGKILKGARTLEEAEKIIKTKRVFEAEKYLAAQQKANELGKAAAGLAKEPGIIETFTKAAKPYHKAYLESFNSAWDATNGFTKVVKDSNKAAKALPIALINDLIRQNPDKEDNIRKYYNVPKTTNTTTSTSNSSVKPIIKKTSQYDTQLDSSKEQAYQKWKQTLPKNLQYEGDYDLRGFYKDNPNFNVANPEQHLTDKYKKPNHPTFSVESKYYKEGMPAGTWDGDTYVPINRENKTQQAGAINIQSQVWNDISDIQPQQQEQSKGKPLNDFLIQTVKTPNGIKTYIRKDRNSPFIEQYKYGGKIKKLAGGGIIGADGKSETQPQGMGAGAITGIVGNALDTVGNFIPVDNDGRGVSKKGQAISGGIQTGLDSAADIANSIPGGQIVGGALKIGSFLTKGITAIVDAVKEHKHPTDELVNEKYSPTYKDSSFSFGNNILALGGDTSNNLQNQFKQYDTVSHAEGGQNIDANNNPTSNPDKAKAEIEKKENSYKNYVFSDELGFAKLAKKINKKYEGREDLISKKSLDLELTELMKKNEKAKQEIEQNQQMAQKILKFGGNLFENYMYSPDGKLFTSNQQYQRYENFYNPQELFQQPIINNYNKLKIKNNNFQFKYGGKIPKATLGLDLIDELTNVNKDKQELGATGVPVPPINWNMFKNNEEPPIVDNSEAKADSEFYKPGQVGTAIPEKSKKQFSPEAIAGYGIKGIEMLGHAIQAFKKPDLVNPVYNPEENKVKSLMSNRKFDSQAILDALDLQDTANRQNINDNSTSVGVIQANLQKANANQVNAIANTKIQEQQTNNQYRADEAQVLNNLGQQKMQAQVYAEDVNAKSKANVQMQRDKFLKESIGGLGDFLLKKDYVNKDNEFQMNILKSKGINFEATDYKDWNKTDVDIAKFTGELESETDTAKRKAKMEEVHQKFLAKGGTEEAWQSNSIAQGLTNKYLK